MTRALRYSLERSRDCRRFAVTFERNTNLGKIDFGSLEYIGQSLNIYYNDVLELVNMTKLATVTNSLTINTNYELLRLNFKGLVTVSSTVSISSNTKLEAFSMARLASCGSFSLSSSLLTQLSLPSLTSSGSFSITSNSAMQWLSLPSVTSVGGQMSISSNSAMLWADVKAQSISSGLLVNNNYLLESLYFERVTYIYQLCDSCCYASGYIENICIYSNDALVNATFPLLNMPRASDYGSKGTFIPFNIHAQFADYTWWFGGATYATAPRPDLFYNPAGAPTLGVNDSTTCVGDAIPYTTDLLLCDMSYFVNASTVRKITGALRIRGPAYMLGTSLASSFDYPQLNSTGTQLHISGLTTATTAIRMPSLNTIGTDFWYIRNYANIELSLPALHNIQNDLWYIYCGSSEAASLHEFNLPTLYSIGNDLVIEQNQYGNHTTMAQLQTIGGNMWVYYNYMSARLSLVSLQTVGEYIDIRQNSQYTYTYVCNPNCAYQYVYRGIKHIELTSLQSVGSYIRVYNNDKLQLMDLTSLQTVPEYRACATPPLTRARLVCCPD